MGFFLSSFFFFKGNRHVISDCCDQLAVKLTGIETGILCMANLCFKSCIHLIRSDAAVVLSEVQVGASRLMTDQIVAGCRLFLCQSHTVLKTVRIEGKRTMETILDTFWPHFPPQPVVTDQCRRTQQPAVLGPVILTSYLNSQTPVFYSCCFCNISVSF